MIETIRLSHSEFFVNGPEVDYDIETWYCCRGWPVVVASTTHSREWPKREAWFIRKCGICREYPRPERG